MPSIKEYSAPEGLRIQPSSVGTEATAAAARRIGAFSNQTADAYRDLGQRVGSTVRDFGDAAVDYIAHREISHGAAQGMALIQNKTNEWNDTAKNADPNDPSVAGKFTEESLNPALDKFRENFTTAKGQAWAEHFVDQYRQHMFAKTSADMSSMAADAVHMNAVKTSNAAATNAYNDPSSLNFTRDALKTSVEALADSSPNLTPVARTKIKNDLGLAGEEAVVKAAVMGAITKGGDWKAIADDPRNAPFLKPGEAQLFEKAAKQQQRGDLLQQKQLEDYQHTQQVRDGATKLGQAFTDNVTYDDQMRPIVKPGLTRTALEIARQNPTAADHARTLINWGEAQLRSRKESVLSDPAVKKDLYDGLFRTDSPTTEVALMKAQIDGKLSNQDFQQLHNLQKTLEEKPLKGPLYQGTMEAVKGMLGVSVMPDGHQRYGNFVQTFIPAYLALDEKSRAAALNLKDPNSLISKSMEGIKPTPAQLMVGHALRNTGMSPEMVQSLTLPAVPGVPAAPRVMPPPGPGETPRPGAKPRPVSVTTPAEAQKLNPGTRYMRPGDDTVYVR